MYNKTNGQWHRCDFPPDGERNCDIGTPERFPAAAPEDLIRIVSLPVSGAATYELVGLKSTSLSQASIPPSSPITNAKSHAIQYQQAALYSATRYTKRTTPPHPYFVDIQSVLPCEKRARMHAHNANATKKFVSSDYNIPVSGPLSSQSSTVRKETSSLSSSRSKKVPSRIIQ